MTEADKTPWYRTPLVWIMAGLSAWGLYLAIGGYMYGGPKALLRAALIMGCTVVFLLFWVAVLSLRKRRENDAT